MAGYNASDKSVPDPLVPGGSEQDRGASGCNKSPVGRMSFEYKKFQNITELQNLIDINNCFEGHFKSVLNGTVGYIAFHCKKPIGYIHGHMYGEEFEIDYILIDNNYRNQGIGSYLIKFAILIRIV